MPSATGVMERAGHEAAPWIQRLARLGYAAKGVVYIVIGGMAVQTAVGERGTPEGTEGALVTLLRQPMGRVMLGLVALGLAGYVVWRLVQAFLDPEHKGTDAKGLARRAGFLISGVIYGGLTLEAIRMLRGEPGGGKDSSHWTALVMQEPAGRWVIGLIGAGIIGYGLFQLFRGVTRDIAKRLALGSLEPAHRKNVVRLGRIGLATRGVVFVMAGWFLVRAAREFDPSEARGLEGALQSLASQPRGPWLIGAAGLGLMAYGAFQLAKARYRQISTPG